MSSIKHPLKLESAVLRSLARRCDVKSKTKARSMSHVQKAATSSLTMLLWHNLGPLGIWHKGKLNC